MKHRTMGTDASLHVRGETRYIDDHPVPESCLHAAVFTSPVARGRITSLDTAPAMEVPGVRAVFSAEDIPGENQIGGIFPDEELLAETELKFIGQAVAVVIAENPEAARKGAGRIVLEAEELEPVLDPREAYGKGQIIGTPRIFSLGDVDSAWDSCDVIVEGRVETGGQEHLYLETQGAIALPREDGTMKIVSATQNPSHVQHLAARVLGFEMHQVEVEVPRLGGAFGGKEEQGTSWACMAALAAYRLRVPVKLVLNRREDLAWTGKRHPYSSDYKLGVKADGTFVAYEAAFYQNAGATADLSSAILERTLFHSAGSYFVPNTRVTGFSCRTNVAPNTAFRGFGGPQGMFVFESAVAEAAAVLGKEPAELQKKNLLNEGDMFPYGMKTSGCTARRCFSEAEQDFGVEEWRRKIEKFNGENDLFKKGLACMPVCFGISFTNTTLNQANSLVHVYKDGSVGVSTAAVEMGQGVKQKMVQVAADIFSLSPGEDGTYPVRIEFTNTTRNANTSPTAASTGSDLNGKATEAACIQIRDRLLHFAAGLSGVSGEPQLSLSHGAVVSGGRKTELTWKELVSRAYLERINLSAHAHYATPDIYFDKSKEKGEPFAYHVYGTAFVEATVDCLRGTYRFDAVRAVHDGGTSMNNLVDRGQSEGGIVQGLGWLTIEELLYSDAGRPLADTMNNCKVPDIYFVPDEITVKFLENSPNPFGIFNSKAVGEPPFMYGIAGYFALRAAVDAFRAGRGGGTERKKRENRKGLITTPMTPERVLTRLYD